MKRSILVAVAAVACLILAAPAMGDLLGTVKLSNNNNSLSDTCYIWGDGYSGANVYSGVYSWTVVGYTFKGKDVPNWGFCVDLPDNPLNNWNDVRDLADAPRPSYPAKPSGPMGSQKAAYIQELWGRNFDMAWITAPNATNSKYSTLTNRQVAECFGVAIWEIVYEEYKANALSYDVTTDNTGDPTKLSDWGFYASGLNTVVANGMLRALNGTGPQAGVFAVSSDTGQDFAVIPAPAAILLGALGLGLVGWLKRRMA